MIKKYISVFICCLAIIVPSLSACSAKTDNTKQQSKKVQVLTIDYDSSKYGSKWISLIADAFKKEHANVDIKLEADPQIGKKITTILEQGKNVPDIAFTDDTNWQYWASKGYMHDLTSIYNEKINSKKLKDKIQPDYLNHCLYKEKYWIIPWDDGATGFIYNENMFKQYNWQVPQTMSDFMALLSQIKSAGIKPLAWAGQNIDEWKYAVDGWWAQSEGYDGIQKYLAMDSPDVYAQKGRLVALQTFQNIVSDKTNSIDNVIDATEDTAEKEFFDSKAAMILDGSWIESKVGDSLPDGFEMKMMNLPTVDGAKDNNINVTGAGDFAFIPASAKQITLASEFLAFMSTNKMLDLFTKVTSVPRPFVYDATNVNGLSDFGESVANIWQSSRNIYMFSQNPVYYNVFSDWPKDGTPFMQIFLGNETPDEAYSDNVIYAKDNWDSAVKRNS